MTKMKVPKKLFVAGALVLLTPLFLFANRPDYKKGCDASSRHADKKCQQVPDGGLRGEYLFALGATCLGAMLMRSRFRSKAL